jgi:hypothetical protein
MLTVLLQDPRLPPDTVAIIAESDWVLDFADLNQFFGEQTQPTSNPTSSSSMGSMHTTPTRCVDWSQRVDGVRLPPTSACHTNATLSVLVKACNVAMKAGHGDLIFLSAEYNNSRRAMFPSNGTQAVAVTTRSSAALHHLLAAEKPWHIDKILMAIGVSNRMPSPFSSSAVYKPFGNSSTHESGCSQGSDKHWTGLERPGAWGAKYIALTTLGVERWIIKPAKKGSAEYLGRLLFPDDDEKAVWRTLRTEEGQRPSFGAYIDDAGTIDMDFQPRTKYAKRKRRSMLHKSSFRVYTLDADEAAIRARHTQTLFSYMDENTRSANIFP